MGNHPKEKLAKFKRILLYFAVLEPIVSKYGDFRRKNNSSKFGDFGAFFSHETSCLHMAISERKKILKIWLLMSQPGFMPLGNPN
jgi:hypothetical protein